MTSSKGTVQEPPRRGLRLPALPTPFNNEPSHQAHHTVLTDTVFNPKRSSQHNKHFSIVPDSTTPNLKRRSSRFGLSGLFSRSKPLATDEVHEKLGVQWECDEPSGTPTSADPAGLQKYDIQHLSPGSQVLPVTEPHTVPLRNRASKTALRSKPSFKKEFTIRSSIAWDPPPLSQAYPQAVRHATLRAPSLSAETILRLNAERNISSNRRVKSYTPEAHEIKVPKEKKLKKPTALDLLSKRDWTDKTFVLLTSGYFLQYAGQGPSDRLPEKIMPLSKESAAFASDAIPGKPYVLQISQVSDEHGTVDTDASRSMFKSLGLRSQMKRTTSSFLLVFESSDELSTWMIAVRKEIQSMGGREYRPDEFRKPVQVESIQELRQIPSQRYVAKRDPSRSSQNPGSVASVTLSDNALSPEPSKVATNPGEPTSFKRQSMATQQSVDSRTTSNTAESINQIHLDRLRESPRQSYASTAGKTTSSSRDSSPGPSPINVHADIPQWAPNFNERRQTTSMYHGLVRSSVQQLKFPSPPAPPSSHQTCKTSLPRQRCLHCERGHVSLTYTPQQQRTPSPAAPNFSVPTFSKRYSSSNNSASSCTTSKPHTPPASHINASPSPPVVSEQKEHTGKRASIRELQHLQKPSLRVSNGPFPSTSTPPRSADVFNSPSSSDAVRPFSRRFSSLEYSRGLSPLQLASQSPSPHPPPTTALPAIPGANLSSRSPSIKPPSSPLTPLPGAEESRANSTTPTTPTAWLAFSSVTPLPRTFIAPSPSLPPTALPGTQPPRRNFLYPPPTKALPAVPDSSRASMIPSPPRTQSHESTAHDSSRDSVMAQAKISIPIAPKIETLRQSSLVQTPTTPEKIKSDPIQAHGLGRPLSMEVRSQPPAPPTRDPPPPPSEQRPQLVVRKSSPRIGRESPPASALPSPSRISVISPAINHFDEAAPHPFIPPIMVSESKFRGSLDGPWNPAYGAPNRTFLD